MKCQLCKKPCATESRIQPYSKQEYLYTFAYCQEHLTQRNEAAKTLGLPTFYADFLHRIPKSKVDVNHADVTAWYERHEHPEVYTGAIGGALSTYTCHTSIGDMHSLHCGICGEEASVDDEL